MNSDGQDAPVRASGGSLMDRLIGGVLGLLALVVYLATLSSGAYPGESAALIAEFTGLLPKMLPTHPLWAGLVWIVSRLPLGGGIAARLNVVSAMCGAACVWLLYDLMRRVVAQVIDPFAPDRRRAVLAGRLAGVSAALFLAFCAPFWIVSNRAHTASFDILLILAIVSLLWRWKQKGGVPGACLVAFLCAAASVEFATANLLLPAVGIILLIGLWRRGGLWGLTAIWVGLSALAGLMLYLVAAWVFVGSEGYVARGYTGFGHVLTQMLKVQYQLLARSLPREGWLIILFITVVPWLTALGVGRRGLNEERDWSYYLLHIIMTALAIVVLVNVRIAPWPMLKAQAEFGRGRLLVTPYVLSASLFGYLVAYWFLLPASWWERAESRFVHRLRAWLGPLFVAPALVAVAAMPFFNHAASDGGQSRFVNAYADAVVANLAGRDWLVTDGSVDNHLLICAGDRRQPLTLLSMPASSSELYMRYVAGLFDDVRLKNLAEIGMLPLLQEWMSKTDDITERLAVQAIPDLWVGGGFVPVPHKLVFLGGREQDPPATAGLLAEHEACWNALVPALKHAKVHSERLQGLQRHLLRHTGLVANNLGVFLEDHGGADQDAFTAYARAREIDPDNVSALLNQSVMADRGAAPEAAVTGIRNDLEAFVKGLAVKPHIWRLSGHYGYVRMPLAFAQLGMTWAMSGQPGLAVAGLKKAMELTPEAGRAKMKQTLAFLYLTKKDDEASEALYRELLQNDPKNVDALFGLLRVELSRGNHAEALNHLRAARDAGAAKNRVALEWAALLTAAGQADRARIAIEELLELEPAEPRAWGMLMAILIQARDADGLAAGVERMQQVKGVNDIDLALARGHLALMRNAVDEARDQFTRVLRLRPNHVHALGIILRLDVLQKRKDEAEAHAKRLLTLDPDHALANYINASLHLAAGNLLLAEDSYRRSLAMERRPETLNDLAWLLHLRGAHEEAETLARESIKTNPAAAGSWDTLGAILMKTDRMAEAEQAYKQAVSLSKGDPRLQLNLAELYEKTGAKQELRSLLEQMVPNEQYLADSELKRLQRLKESID